jgi:hypothetical protein
MRSGIETEIEETGHRSGGDGHREEVGIRWAGSPTHKTVFGLRLTIRAQHRELQLRSIQDIPWGCAAKGNLANCRGIDLCEVARPSRRQGGADSTAAGR